MLRSVLFDREGIHFSRSDFELQEKSETPKRLWLGVSWKHTPLAGRTRNHCESAGTLLPVTDDKRTSGALLSAHLIPCRGGKARYQYTFAARDRFTSACTLAIDT